MKRVLFVIGIAFAGSSILIAKDECKQDLETYCGQAAKGGQYTVRCLVAAEAKFSEPCLFRLARERGENRSIRDACKADEARLCASAKNPTDVLMCLRTKDNDVSSRCRRVIESTWVDIR